MTKAEEIVRTVLSYTGNVMRNSDMPRLVQKVEDIIDRKCAHPMKSIAVCAGGTKSDWKCYDCGKEVIAVKFEEVK